MPPIHVPPKPKGADAVAPRLEINDNGVAEALIPENFKKNDHERKREVETDRLVDQDGGSARAASPKEEQKNKGPERTPIEPVHLRIGNYQESYMRTKLVDPDEAAELARAQGGMGRGISRSEKKLTDGPVIEPMVIDDETDEEYIHDKLEAAELAKAQGEPMVIDDKTDDEQVNNLIDAARKAADDLDTETDENEDGNGFPAPAGRASIASGIESAQAETAAVRAILQAPDLPPVPAPWQLNAVAPPAWDGIEEYYLANYPFLRGTDILNLLARGAGIRAHDYFQADANGQNVFPLTLVHENAEELPMTIIQLATYPGFPSVPVYWKPSNIPQFLEALGGGARPQPDLDQRGALEEHLVREHQKEVERQETVPQAAIPSVVFMKLADKHTRVRYTSEILTIKGEKYVRLDETHFLYAVNAEYLLEGDNTTLRRRMHAGWPESASDHGAPRPEVLFELYPKGQWEYTEENDRLKKVLPDFRPQCDIFGRVLLNAEDRPLKFSLHIPYRVSTEIEGWEMEALCRYDPELCNQDFCDRMLPNSALIVRGRPSTSSLNHRRRRDRIRMRLIRWPVPAELSYAEKQTMKQLSEQEIERNSTEQLSDLTKEECELTEAIMWGAGFEHFGSNRTSLDRGVLWKRIEANLSLVREHFAADSEEVQMVTTRLRAVGDWR
ncbi:hypothetical protein H2200_004091 [Cladophialophora chaetospira]|uniref:Uncharacterized protein n=1 Tax=Cladophialophora chaetospira TaxID=386627 RepID=A0AA38XFI7_9EURO|nr:hypothetical protein H2200_004091 [Cladophialophora chaetospira]